ncbi:ABC transporter substrate-binding protein [Actinotalea sp. K2]|uniref:ABC transporter substrate-binding protein n=1 Tax=Actinotalea sp. K2 TaxID=2939438 RepID=UPI0020176489|nr:ABC transporter substrate-binding protein [Actinotalea sp. K2]MCL3859482.1 ABC transporter substrate-binding protein [Actinotalea sp. K2]
MNRFTLKAVGLAAAAALTLTACAGGGDDPAAEPDPTTGGDDTTPVTITFTWWGNDDRASRYEESLALFTEEYPHITVQTSFQDFPNYWTARATEAASRSLPDVMQFDLSYLREYSENGHLADLSTHIGNEIDLSGFDDALVQSGVLEGQQVGIPTSTNTLALFYNPGLLEQTGVEAPAEDYTWEDYNEFLAAVSDAGETTPDGQAIYGGADYTNTFWFFLQWLVQEGVTPFNDDGTFGFDESHMSDFLALTTDLREAGQVYPVDRGIQLLPLGGFTVNESASEFSWDNFLAGYTADSGTEDIQMLPVPTGSGGDKAMFFKPSMLLSSGANTEHPEAAATLIDFLLTDPEVGAIFGTSKGVPADQAQRDAMVLEEGSIDATVVEYEDAVAEHVTEPVPVPVKGFGSIEAEYKRLAEELAYGTVTIEQFVDSWFAEAAMMTQ